MNCLTCGRGLADGETCEWHLRVECSVCHRPMAPKPCEQAQDGKTSHGYCEPCFEGEVAKLPEAPSIKGESNSVIMFQRQPVTLTESGAEALRKIGMDVKAGDRIAPELLEEQ